MNNEGKLYLIPCTLGETALFADVLPQRITDVVNTIDEYIVENEKSARQFLKRAGLKKPLQEIEMHLLNKHTELKEIGEYLLNIANGKNIGVISEAGCPGIADPGADVVRIAHQRDIEVVPLVGPSSILLAMMASGFNGQNFTFNGYLPKERIDRIKSIRELEKLVLQKNQAQLFIETPYRNNHIFEDILETCAGDTKLCVACDLTLADEFVVTKTVAYWKKLKPDLSKRPCIFILGK